MTTSVKTQGQFYDIYKNEVIGLAGDLTDFSEGSLHDVLAGAFSVAMNEVSELIISEFKKTFFDTAAGNDLDILALDHFGDKFARPAAQKATGVVTFSRPTSVAGNVTIPLGTVVKTKKDFAGTEIRFLTDAQVTLTGLSITANVTAETAGVAANVAATKVDTIESALTDSTVTVSNVAQMAGGTEQEDDSQYRETIRGLISTLAGANSAAIVGAIKSVPQIYFVSLIENTRPVIEYDIAYQDIKAGAKYFRIPFPIAYIADVNGASSPTLIAQAKVALEPVRAAGVYIDVFGSTATFIDWQISIILNAGGPNFAELSSDTTMITDTMADYINQELAINDGFDRVAAKAYLMAIWGSAGTDDIDDLTILNPSGDIAGTVGVKLLADTMDVV